MGAPEATFYRYEILNRSPNTIEAAHAGFFADPDLGSATDDYVGTDPGRGMAFVYNANETDTDYGTPPALGFDILSGAAATSYFENTPAGPTADPSSGEAIYNFLQGLWGDGTPVRANGNGYDQPATFPITPYMFPADPVAGAYWSEENTDGSGTNNPPGDRRMVVSTPAFTLAPGASHVVDLGILFAQGEDRLGSITELRAVSDAVQAAYASGTLFAPAPPQSLLPAPELLSPVEGALFTDEAPTLEWSAVSGAESYIVEWSTDPAWADPDVARVSPTTLSIPMETLPANRLTRMYWRVRAEADGMKSLYSSTRSFSFYRFQTGILLLDPTGSQTDPTNIAFVEVLGPGGAPVCSDGQPAGCAEVGGDQVYGSPNSTDQYIMYHGGSEGPEATIGSYGPNDFEIRFTEEGSYGDYVFSGNTLIQVPFEVWDIGVVPPGSENDPSDDVQMIPALNGTSTCSFDYADGESIFGRGTTSDWIYAYYPADGQTYADWAAYAAPLVSANGGCAPAPAGDLTTFFSYASSPRGRPIQRVLFEDTGIGSMDAMQGVVIRFYTSNQTTPPVASGNEASTPVNTSVLIDVLVNDSDPNGNALSVESVTDPANGSAVIETGQVRYTPEAGFTGTDAFDYTALATETAAPTRRPSPSPSRRAATSLPIALSDAATTPEATSVLIDVLANDTDPNGDVLAIAAVTEPARGSAVIESGQVRYTPEAGYIGTDAFTYTLGDGSGETDTAEVLHHRDPHRGHHLHVDRGLWRRALDHARQLEPTGGSWRRRRRCPQHWRCRPHVRHHVGGPRHEPRLSHQWQRSLDPLNGALHVRRGAGFIDRRGHDRRRVHMAEQLIHLHAGGDHGPRRRRPQWQHRVPFPQHAPPHLGRYVRLPQRHLLARLGMGDPRRRRGRRVDRRRPRRRVGRVQPVGRWDERPDQRRPSEHP